MIDNKVIRDYLDSQSKCIDELMRNSLPTIKKIFQILNKAKTNGNKIDGGILLYAAQPGTEGTLGGLTALVPYFKSFLDIALEKVNWCSGDPLCGQNEFHIGKANGASCDVCLMNSETSCEHRNMWLDRTILINSLP